MAKTDSFDLSGKTLIVTGAGRGIGRAIAEVAAGFGADLVLGSRTLGEIETVAERCRAQGRRAHAIVVDVTDEHSIETFVSQAWDASDAVWCLVNNVGYVDPKPALDYTTTEIDHHTGVNYRSALLMSLALGRRMIKAKNGGAIVSITSQSGLVGAPLRTPYAAAKGAIHQMTRSLAGEWAPYGLTVNAVAPTFTRTPLLESATKNPAFAENLAKIPLGRIAEPEEIAAAVVYLASDAARMVTGQVLAVDGGYTTVR